MKRPKASVSWHQAAEYCNRLSGDELDQCYVCGADQKCAARPGYEGEGIYSCPGYRLPTESEWEYAYRAGSVTALYSGPLSNCTEDDENASSIGWYFQNSNSGTSSSEVKDKEKDPNAWGLHDMAGNVWEICHDNFKKNLGADLVVDPWGAASEDLGKVIRGGGFSTWAQSLRAAERYSRLKELATVDVGFRCVKTVR